MKVLHPGLVSKDGAVSRAPRLRDIEGRRVVLLDNNHVNVDRLLDRLGERLQAQHRVSVLHLKKPYANAGAPADVMEEVVREADAVINGIAD